MVAATNPPLPTAEICGGPAGVGMVCVKSPAGSGLHPGVPGSAAAPPAPARPDAVTATTATTATPSLLNADDADLRETFIAWPSSIDPQHREGNPLDRQD